MTICACSFVLNSVVMVALYRVSSFRTTSHYLMFSMSVDDWLRSVFVLPVAVYGNYVYWWTLDHWYCQYFGLTSTFLGLNSMIHLTALAIERCRRTSNPFDVPPDLKVVKWIILGLWLFAFTWSTFPIIGWSSYSIEPGNFGCSIAWYSTTTSDRAYIVCLFLIFFFVPLITNFYCYTHIYMQIKFLSKRDSKRWGDQSMATTETLKAKKKCTKIALCMVMGFLFAWSPYAIVSMCTTFGYQVTPLATTASAIFAKTSSVYNPIILMFLHKNFRKQLKAMITCSFYRSQSLRNLEVSHV